MEATLLQSTEWCNLVHGKSDHAYCNEDVVTKHTLLTTNYQENGVQLDNGGWVEQSRAGGWKPCWRDTLDFNTGK